MVELRRAVLAAVAALGLAAGGAPPPARAGTLPPRMASTPLDRMQTGWWRDRFATKKAEIAQGGWQLVFYGDSITQNLERTGPEPWQDFRPVWDRFYAGRHALNLGFKGDLTSHLLWRILHGEADGLHPKAAVVLIGANNFGRQHWPAAETGQAIETIIAELRRRLPGTHILLLGVLPSIRSPWVDANTVALNRALAARYAGGQEAVFMDVSRVFERGGVVDREKFMDIHLRPPEPPLHPTPDAQAAICALIEPVLARWLGDRPRP